MRATLLVGDPDLAAVLCAVFGQVEIGLTVVSTIAGLLRQVEQASPDDFLILERFEILLARCFCLQGKRFGR